MPCRGIYFFAFAWLFAESPSVRQPAVVRTGVFCGGAQRRRGGVVAQASVQTESVFESSSVPSEPEKFTVTARPTDDVAVPTSTETESVFVDCIVAGNATCADFEPTGVAPPPLAPTDTTDGRIRNAIFAGNVVAAAAEMNVGKAFAVGAGLRYTEEYAPFVIETPQRNSDPDVVAFKAIATSVLETGDIQKLANAIAYSFVPDCACSPYTAEEIDALATAFETELADVEHMVLIVEADARTNPGRKLTALNTKPTSSLVCTYCWPKKPCKAAHWC